ncbi:MAG: hypothetical protein ACO31G_11080, partial [Ilumatobacteraceae bacterium]
MNTVRRPRILVPVLSAVVSMVAIGCGVPTTSSSRPIDPNAIPGQFTETTAATTTTSSSTTTVVEPPPSTTTTTLPVESTTTTVVW